MKTVKDKIGTLFLNTGMRKEKMHWLDARLEQLSGKSLAGLAKVINVPASRLSEMKRGSWHLKTKHVQAVARYLEWPCEQLLRKIAGQHAVVEHEIDYKAVTVRGEVAAGYWRESPEWSPDEWITVYVTTSGKLFQDMRVYGVKVIGDSMNRVFPHGTILECVTYIDLERQPQSGEYVLVRRRNRQGLYETSVKKFVVDEKGKPWLLPESDKPEYQQPLVLEDNGEDDQIVIVARVIRAHIDL